MSIETALWILGVGVPAILSWCIWASWVLLRIQADTKKIVLMHQDPDKYGFGTGATNNLVDALTRAIRELTHYIRWDIEDRTGKKPPPPL